MGRRETKTAMRWPIALGLWILLATAAGAEDRVEIRVGPHKSDVNEADKADVLAGMLQSKINTIPSDISADQSLATFVTNHVASSIAGITSAIWDLEAVWEKEKRILVLVAGRYFDENKTFTSTFYIGPRTTDFNVDNTTVDLQATPDFRNQDNLANLLLYYAMIRDAQIRNLQEPSVVKLVTRACEMAKSVQAQSKQPGDVATATTIKGDLEKLQPC